MRAPTTPLELLDQFPGGRRVGLLFVTAFAVVFVSLVLRPTNETAPIRAYLDGVRSIENSMEFHDTLCPTALAEWNRLGSRFTRTVQSEANRKGIDLSNAPGILRGSDFAASVSWNDGLFGGVIADMPTELGEDGAKVCPDENSGWLGILID